MKSIRISEGRYMVTDGEVVYESSTPIFEKEKTIEETPDEKPSNKYFFSNIIVFTNERDSAKNKTLKNLEEAIKDKTDIDYISALSYLPKKTVLPRIAADKPQSVLLWQS